MLTLSEYLRAERFDSSEPASFYVPGVEDWEEVKTKREAREYVVQRRITRVVIELDLEDDPTIH